MLETKQVKKEKKHNLIKENKQDCHMLFGHELAECQTYMSSLPNCARGHISGKIYIIIYILYARLVV